jgi:hypothetical protein
MTGENPKPQPVQDESITPENEWQKKTDAPGAAHLQILKEAQQPCGFIEGTKRALAVLGVSGHKI